MRVSRYWGTRRVQKARCLCLGAVLLAGCSTAEPPAFLAPPPPAPMSLKAADARDPRTAAVAYNKAVPLAAFFEALANLEAHKTERVTILQIGDSHTAGDYFSGRLRSLFQNRFGDAGRGAMQAGLPFVGVRQKEVSISQSGTWKVSNSLTAPTGGPYDISGFISTSVSSRASMTLTPADNGHFDRARVDFLRKPGGAPIEIRIDGERRAVVSTAGSLGEMGHASITAPASHEFQLVAISPGTRILGWSIDRFTPGVVLDSFGVVSATVNLIDQWDPTLVRQSIREVEPSLIILAYGTNEGFGTLDGNSYFQEFAHVLETLKRDAPNASILVVGPPEAARADARCLKSGSSSCVYEVPPALFAVREIERQAATEAGALFWDWSAFMAHEGGLETWVRADPALSRADHVHQTVAGYELSAQALFAELMRRYDNYRAADNSAAQSS